MRATPLAKMTSLSSLTTEQVENVGRLKAALRSGEYMQGMGKLKVRDADGYKYCCLGVAAELVGRELRLLPSLGYVYGYDTAMLALEDAEKYGFDKPVLWREVTYLQDVLQRGWFANMIRAAALAHLNDSGASFEEIATTIEVAGWDR